MNESEIALSISYSRAFCFWCDDWRTIKETCDTMGYRVFRCTHCQSLIDEETHNEH